jgi:hypothetical protein
LRGMRQVSAAKYVGSRLAGGLGEARGGAGGLLKRRPAPLRRRRGPVKYLWCAHPERKERKGMSGRDGAPDRWR